MNKYTIRTTKADYNNMIKLGGLLGAIEVTSDGIHAPGGCWDYIGVISEDTGKKLTDSDGIEYPEKSVLADKNGNEYIHVNLITPVNLRDAAAALAKARPEVAAALADLSKYFMTDANGNAVAPANPHRVFAT